MIQTPPLPTNLSDEKDQYEGKISENKGILLNETLSRKTFQTKMKY